jgi:tetratricopeptide (TPR) repeat protein
MADKAIATYQKALDILGEAAGRSTLTVKMGIGQAYMLKEDWQNGALWLEKAQEVDDARFGNAFLARDLGSCYEHLGRDRDALDQYQRAGRTNGGDPGTLEAIRRLKEKLGLSEDEEKQKDEGEE